MKLLKTGYAKIQVRCSRRNMAISDVNIKGFSGFDICFTMNTKRLWYLECRTNNDLFDVLAKAKLPEGFELKSTEASGVFGIWIVFRLHHIPTLEELKQLKKVINSL